jgi:hypothetical protein
MDKRKVVLYECGGCGEYHEDKVYADYRDDCRYDENRYANAEDYSERRGVPEDEIDVVELDEEDDDE